MPCLRDGCFVIRQKGMRQWFKTGNTSGFQPEDSGSNPDCRIWFELVENDIQRFAFDKIVETYHGYKTTTDSVGRLVNWLIRDQNNSTIGAIGIGSSVMAMKPRDDFIGWNKEQRLKNLVKTATNWRFCLIEGGYGSKVISVLHHEAPKRWKEKFGDKLVLLETLVQPLYLGTCYKASGWNMVGKTKGIQFKWKDEREILSTDNIVQKFMLIGGKKDLTKWKVQTGFDTPKYIFLKPLHRYWQRELCS